MKVALVNPRWTFEDSIDFGCRESHLPLELGQYKHFSDIQEDRPRPLAELERRASPRG